MCATACAKNNAFIDLNKLIAIHRVIKKIGEVKVEVDLPVAVAAHIDRHTVDKPGQIGAVIKIEPAPVNDDLVYRCPLIKLISIPGPELGLAIFLLRFLSHIVIGRCVMGRQMCGEQHSSARAQNACCDFSD